MRASTLAIIPCIMLPMVHGFQSADLTSSETVRPQNGFHLHEIETGIGANQIKSADDAYSFMAHMRLSYQNKPHWQVARQALNHAGASDASEIQAWRTFRSAAAAEGWLLD